jgi:hypothetical protein
VAHTSPSLDLLDGRILKYLDDSDDPAASVLLWWQGANSREPTQPLADTGSSVVVTAEENTPPSGADNSFDILDDPLDPYVFQVADFGFSDIDGHELTTVFVTELPTSGGTLFLDEVIFAGGDVSAAQLGDGLFVFQPAVTTTGPADATFKFRVVDSLGGVSDPENQISIHVTPIDRVLTTYGPGPDSVVGGTLVGGAGADLLTGGIGSDVFDYNALSESSDAAPDQITDFIYDPDGDQDLIDLSGIDANTTAPKDQAFMLVAGFSNNPGELMFDSGTLMGDVNGDSLADFAILLAVGGVESTYFIL